jgi:plastocyanin
MSKNLWTVIIVVIVLLAGGWLFVSTRSQVTPPTVTAPASGSPIGSAAPEGTESAQTAENLITITTTSFSPDTLTIKVGDSVTWTNSDTKLHTVNSDPHPAHTLYPDLNDVGNISAGQSKSFTFTEVGTYKYHDHLNPSLVGTIIVE